MTKDGNPPEVALDSSISLNYKKSVTTTMTGKNQITLPAELVKELDLHPGVRIEWSIGRSGAIVGRRVASRSELAARLAGRGRQYLRPGSDPIAELIRDRVREDREEGLP